jgi:DNA topoisomerase-2
MSPKINKKRYIKKDPIEHILLRPDMYTGSTRAREIEEYVAEKKDDEFRIFQSTIMSSPAILRVFIEPLSNTLDNIERSRKTKTPCTKIKVYINQDNGETKIWNDGDIVPIELNDDGNCYIHSMIFGQLLTGSNYDDEKERVISGRNGLGVKLTNIFSTKFKVHACDPGEGKLLTQIWTNNMKETEGPVVKSTKLKKGFTEVTWTPDFKRFGMKKYTIDIINLYTRFILDAAMLAQRTSNVDLYFNDELVNIKSLTSYSRLYKSPTTETLLIKTPTSDVLITPAFEFQAVSFVNGVYTRLGGQHVDAWSESIFRPIVNKFNKPKKPQINIRDVKQFFRIFVVATVINPEFDGQDKNKLESPSIKVSVQKKHINTICKWSVIAQIEDIIRGKEMVVLKKAERKNKFVKIEGLDPANNEGTKYSSECTLILCEGLSAKTYAVAGIQKGVYGKTGRDWFGIYPLRGKVLNVRNSAPATIAKNAVISDLIKALGVKHGVDYTIEKNFNTLRYGKILIMTDADVDGIHIEALIMNLVHSLFPTLLDRPKTFIVSMKTPIVRVFKPRGKDLLFYDERRYRDYANKQTKAFKSKYYKGLGTTRPEDVEDTFGLKMVEYINDENTSVTINKVFSKKCADSRKEWLASYDRTQATSLDDMGVISKMNMSPFLNNEMIKFSFADCNRSIPCGLDGMKDSHRKVMYAVKKRKLKHSGSSLKVAQLGGYVAEHSNYEHGENNLFDTITKMANEFTGSNNIPLLYRDGMFGTRLEGGKDAASPRYIFTKEEALTHLIFREEDDVLLKRVYDNDEAFEPVFYVPIIPMILINGCTAGIGTGWSCNVPCYNPLDIISAIKIWLDNDGEVLIEDVNTGTTVSMFPEFTPWYRGFKGVVEPSGDNRFKTLGICEKVKGKKNTSVVTELPIGMWTNKFKENCEQHIESKMIKSMKNYSTPKKVNFVLTESPDGFSCKVDTLKLFSYVYTSNMVLFDQNGKLVKYNTVDEIIDNFCIVRYEYYGKRKKHILNSLEKELRHLGNKERFISEVIAEELLIMNEKESEILYELEERGYDKDNDSYDYLLRLQVRTFTENKVIQLKKDIESAQTKVDKTKAMTKKQMWLNDLNEFEAAYSKWLKVMDKDIVKKKK